ncbi:glycosylphosphatidylinositol anchor attachment 1 protein-like [Panonychus citri]|uniref:glycosylphosphatidylinositol anchor attachment 1 protein-like n=1 Tax=Panonychus citri TaxID=50023 RepID=UPI0023081FA5|nr:glycosylphosphatidylinositol anchor attachment 1 protein-like [Panonychus citri]
MGLLFDENKQILTLFTNHCNKISFLCICSAIIVTFTLVSEGYVDPTYFSENALLPGYVNREFSAQPYLNSVLTRLKDVTKSRPGEFVSDWLVNEFNSIGLHSYEHNYTFEYPFDDKKIINGKSVYAILEAPRAPNTEALIISSPYQSSKKFNGKTLPGIGLMLAMAKYFSKKSYLAKDVIFLISGQEIGFQAWLDSYHEVYSSPVLTSGYLTAKSGPIQAAVNLQIDDEDITQLEIEIEGINGQLPNLDLFNVAVELATRESITPTFHGKSHPFSTDFYQVSQNYALTTASMMISQGKTKSTGLHGIFQKYAIQAITLKGIGQNSGNKQDDYLSVPFYVVGRVVEGVFRSLNNLLERFNRSYWFYLLPSTRRYISIGYYMIPFGLLVIPLLFKALNIYLKMNLDSCHDESGSLWAALPFNFYCHVCGFLVASLPFFLQRFAWIYQSHNLAFKEAIYYSLIVSSLLFIFNPLVKLNKNSIELLKARQCVTLINLALILSCLSLFNISLALFLTILMMPIAYICVSLPNNLLRKLFSPLVFLIHPLSISYLCILGTSLWFNSQLDITSHIQQSFQNHKSLLLGQLEDWYIYGNWTYLFGSAFLFPIWLQIID